MVKQDEQTEIKYQIPREAEKYPGEFIVFFPEDDNPALLFHSLIPEEAYKQAEEIKVKTKRTPVVIRAVDTQSNLLQLLMIYR